MPRALKSNFLETVDFPLILDPSHMAKLTSNGRKGLLAGGNWIIDQVKIIDVYPQPEQLGNIRAQSQGTGGAPYNVLIDLAKSGAPFPLFGAGLVGQDALGQEILQDCRAHKIDVRHLNSTTKALALVVHKKGSCNSSNAPPGMGCTLRMVAHRFSDGGLE